MSVNSPIPATSTSETTVFPEVVQPYPKALLRIIRRFRKRAKLASLTSTPEEQKNEEEQLKISRKEKKEKQQISQFKFSWKLPKLKTKRFPEKSKKIYERLLRYI
ncbi:hypothetical protein AVEN_178211-1 [Araneus ventricosus]|uniref:Uncharacterized protein n=1 Tax=Araneus ventricosus TaxID=182803 RepID=A0A4Y2H4C1_ARAVE|nr:hypothetical protein AVEN_178211-1 [Araneus ventricosus]